MHPSHRRRVTTAAAGSAVLALIAGCTADASAPTGPEATSAETTSRARTAPATPATASAPAEVVRDDALAALAPPVAATGVTETFDDPADLGEWRVSYGEPLDGPASVTVVGGALRIVSSHSAWLDNGHGTGVARTIDGDVSVVVDVAVTGTASDAPTVDWSLAGVMLRWPGRQGDESWLHWSAGHVGSPVLERKATVNGHSQLTLVAIEPGPVRLQLIRAGEQVIMLHRQGDEPWQRDATYGWPGAPSRVELILTAQSGYEDDHADMVASFDAVSITPGAPPADVLAAIAAGDTSGLAR